MGKIKDFIEYVKNYKENVRELENLDRDLDNLKIRYASRKNDIDDLEKENKLQQIEVMFENKKVILKDLKELIKGEE